MMRAVINFYLQGGGERSTTYVPAAPSLTPNLSLTGHKIRKELLTLHLSIGVSV